LQLVSGWVFLSASLSVLAMDTALTRQREHGVFALGRASAGSAAGYVHRWRRKHTG